MKKRLQLALRLSYELGIMTEYVVPPNTKKADYIWAYLSEDAKGNHGIVASIIPYMGSTPLVTLSEVIADLMKSEALNVQQLTGQKIVLGKFKLDSIIPL